MPTAGAAPAPPQAPSRPLARPAASRGQAGVVTSGGAAGPARLQDGVAAAIGAGAVPGARREGAAGAATAAVLLPLLQRAPLARVRLARGNGGPAELQPHTGRDRAGQCSLRTAIGLLSRHSIAFCFAIGCWRGWRVGAARHGARGLAAGDEWGGAAAWIGWPLLSVSGARAVIGWGER